MNSSPRSILSLIVFFLTNLVGVFPFKVPVPVPTPASVFATKAAVQLRLCHPAESCCEKHPDVFKQNDGPKALVHWYNVTVGFQTAPLAAVLLLLAAGAIHGTEVREGITGTSGIQPLDVMALFISLAYLAISLDVTGLFRFLAFWVVRKGGSSGRRLYLYLYIFFFVAGVFFGNDPVILFGTPFLAYFARTSGIVPPTAWVSAQFIAANTAAAILPSSNLTNLVLIGAFNFTFVSYVAHSIIPTLATAVAIFPLLAYVLFRSRDHVPKEIEVVDLQSPTSDLQPELPSTEPRRAPGELKDKRGAIIGSTLMGIALAVLVGTSPLKIPVWRVTVPAALLMLARDIWHDRKLWLRYLKRTKTRVQEGQTISLQEQGSIDRSDLEVTSAFSQETQVPVDEEPERKQKTLQNVYSTLRKDMFPTALTVFPRLPVSLVLFAFCMFILVQALSTWGWVEVFAQWWTSVMSACEKSGTGAAVVGAVFIMLIISTFLCNICGTNIGTTILLARVLQTWLSSASTVDPKVRLGAIYALALGTNFGAYTFSFSASLAGLLWRDTLKQKGFEVSQKRFAVSNLPVIGLAICVAGAVLIAEVNVVPR